MTEGPSTEPAARTFVVPCADLDAGAPWRWLRAGWRDMRRAPGLTRPALQATLRAMQGVSLGGVSFSAPTEGKIASGIDVADILVMTHNGRMLR